MMKQLSVFMVGFLSLVVAGSTSAQTNYPEKSIRIIVGLPSGSSPDSVARLLGQELAKTWGKPVLIDNVTGAGGNIAAERLAKAAPDGYTLGLLTEGQIVINPSLYRLAYDPVTDLAAVSQVATVPFVLVVHNAVPAKNVKELVALAKAQPGELTFASGGSGSGPHMPAELLKSAAGIDIRHIPYKGSVAAIPDLLGGRVTMMFAGTAVVLPMVREGKLRALAVASSKRSSVIPELPTITESGYPGFEYTGWFGLFAPASTPGAVIGKLHTETVNALALPDLRAKLAGQGMEGIGNSPTELAALIKSDIPKWARVVKDAGIKLD